MSSDVSLTGGGSNSVTSPDVVTPATAPATTSGTGTTADTVSKSEGVIASGALAAHTPQLLQGSFLLWSMGGNSLAVQNTSNGTPAEVDTHLFLLQTQAKYDEIVTKMLTAWTDSIHKQAQELKREMNTEAYRNWQKVHGHQGYEAWLSSLSPEQRLQAINFPNLDKKATALEGIADNLSEYLIKTKVSGDIQLSQELPFITAALVTTGVFASIPDTVSNSILVQPLKDGGDRSLQAYSPTHATELGYLGSVFMAGSSYFALGQTVAKAGTPKEEINFEFAKNYGEKVLSLVNGSQFNSMAMALLTSRAEKGESTSEERIQNLVMSVKVTLLSTAVALLYKTESSFKGQGGGITGLEFNDLVNGNQKLADSQLKKDLVAAIADARDGMTDRGNSLIASLSNWVDSTKKSADLVDVSGILNNLVYNQAAGTAVAV